MSLHVDHTFMEAVDRKSPLSASEEDFLRKVRHAADQYNVRSSTGSILLQPSLLLHEEIFAVKMNTMPQADDGQKVIATKPKDGEIRKKRERATAEQPQFLATDEGAKRNPLSQQTNQQKRTRSTTNVAIKKERSSTNDIQSEQLPSKSVPKHRLSVPELSVANSQTNRNQEEPSPNEFMPDNISPLVRQKLRLDEPANQQSTTVSAPQPNRNRKQSIPNIQELDEVHQSISSESSTSKQEKQDHIFSDAYEEKPFHDSLERNEFLTPQTVIQRHLEEIHTKKQQFMQEMNELDAEMGTHKAQYDKARLLRLKNQREKELHKLIQDQQFIEEATYQVKEWRIAKKEEEQRQKALEQLRIKEERKRLMNQQSQQVITEIVKVHRQRLENKLIQHLIERIRKEQRRRLRLEQPRLNTPNFMKMQERLRKQQQEEEFAYRQELERQKEARLLKLDKIKEHERLFNEKLKARAEAEKNLVKEVHHAAEFSLKEPTIDVPTVAIQPNLLQQFKERKKRQADYSERLRERKVPIDESRKEQLQMVIDRDVNPIKYEILRGRGLTDLQIFRLKKDFAPDRNPKKHGDENLSQMRIKYSSLKKFEPLTKGQSSLPTTPQPRYINYLPTLSLRKPVDELTEILQKRLSKEEKAKRLIVKSDEIEGNVQKEALSMPREAEQDAAGDPKQYLKVIQKEKKMDSMFLEMLKVRVAAATLLS